MLSKSWTRENFPKSSLVTVRKRRNHKNHEGQSRIRSNHSANFFRESETQTSELMDAAISDVLLPLAPVQSTPHNKVTIVGVGQVGMACAYSILQQVNNLFPSQQFRPFSPLPSDRTLPMKFRWQMWWRTSWKGKWSICSMEWRSRATIAWSMPAPVRPIYIPMNLNFAIFLFSFPPQITRLLPAPKCALSLLVRDSGKVRCECSSNSFRI